MKPTQRLIDFYHAISGRDLPGDGTCDICGRSNVRTWRTERPTAYGIQRAELCGPCLSEDLEMQRRCE